jgi:hypothetical protein
MRNNPIKERYIFSNGKFISEKYRQQNYTKHQGALEVQKNNEHTTIEENKQRRPTTQINTKARANILQYIPAPKER